MYRSRSPIQLARTMLMLVLSIALPALPALASEPGRHARSAEARGERATRGSLDLSYIFFGARTSGSVAKTAVHCSAISLESVTFEVLFLDHSGTPVGLEEVTMGPGRVTRTVVGHLDQAPGGVQLYHDEVLAPLTSDLDQGQVQVRASHPNLVCSAVVLDATFVPPAFGESLYGVRFGAPDTSVAALSFAGARVLPGLVEASVHCTNLGMDPATASVVYVDAQGLVIGATGQFQVGPGQTHTTSTANTALYREDLVVALTGALEQGSITLPLDASNTKLFCTAELVATTAVPPPFLLTLDSQRNEP